MQLFRSSNEKETYTFHYEYQFWNPFSLATNSYTSTTFQAFQNWNNISLYTEYKVYMLYTFYTFLYIFYNFTWKCHVQ